MENSLRGSRVLITGGAGAIGSNLCDLVVQAGAREIVVLDNFVRGRRDNLGVGRGEWARHGGRRRHLRPRRSCDELTAGHRRRLPPGGDPHHAVRRGAPAGARRSWSTARTTCSSPRSAHGVRKVVAASSASVYGLADTFPTTEDAPPLRQRHDLRRREGLQRRAAAQLPRDVRARLRGAALLQRLRPADGHPRRLHRGPRPLDGANHGRRAAADPRRRLADDGLRLHPRRRPRERARRRRGGDRRRLQRRERHRDEPARARARCC